MNDTAEYMIPKGCERCGSDNIAVRVIYSSGVTRYVCLDCGYSRSIAKAMNLKRRVNSALTNWSARVISHHPFCTICGSKENLEAHHIIPVSHSRAHVYWDTNGITLCHQCHSLVHNRPQDHQRPEP